VQCNYSFQLLLLYYRQCISAVVGRRQRFTVAFFSGLLLRICKDVITIGVHTASRDVWFLSHQSDKGIQRSISVVVLSRRLPAATKENRENVLMVAGASGPYWNPAPPPTALSPRYVTSTAVQIFVNAVILPSYWHFKNNVLAFQQRFNSNL